MNHASEHYYEPVLSLQFYDHVPEITLKFFFCLIVSIQSEYLPADLFTKILSLFFFCSFEIRYSAYLSLFYLIILIVKLPRDLNKSKYLWGFRSEILSSVVW